MSITHEQKTFCWCAKCEENKLLDMVTVVDGSEFHKVDPKSHGWTSLVILGVTHWFCPEHKVLQVVHVDDEIYKWNAVPGTQ